MTEPSLTLAEASGLAAAVLDQVERAVIGKRDALSLVLAGVLAGGHVLIEDLPGLGKTVAAHSLATALGLAYTRAQFTPDLLPSDLTGGYIYDQRASEFVFRPGPVFTGLLLADEINRTPPKTQSALLEAMQEHRVSVEGHTFDLPRPFHVLATANPIEHEGTYPLPEAQLDRFLMRLSFGYPSATDEVDVLARRIERRKEEATIDAVLDPERLLAVQDAVEDIYIAPSVLRYVVRLVSATRVDKSVLVGASPRGSLALVACSRAVAQRRHRGSRRRDGPQRDSRPRCERRAAAVTELPIRPTPALVRSLLLGTLLALGGIVFGQPAAAALAMPFVVHVAWALLTRARTDVVRVRTRPRLVAVHEDDSVPVRIVADRPGWWLAVSWPLRFGLRLAPRAGAVIDTTGAKVVVEPHTWGRYLVGPPR